MTPSTEDRILERLDQILKVLSLSVAADQSLTERVRLLKLAGLDNQTAANLLGTTANAVRALQSNTRDRSRKKKKARA